MDSDSKENASQANTPLTLGDLLAALVLLSEKAPPRSLGASNLLQNVDCSLSDSSQRSVLITNAFHIKEALEYIELVYSVSPPGATNARMSRIKLAFSFAGSTDGSIGIWLNHSENPKGPNAPRTFGLGISKVRQGRDACDVYPTIALPKAKELLTCGNDWVELELGGKYLTGNMLQVVLLARYSSHGILSVHLSATTCNEDPKDEAVAESSTDEDVEVLKWCNSRLYERHILGGQTLEEYHEH